MNGLSPELQQLLVLLLTTQSDILLISQVKEIIPRQWSEWLIAGALKMGLELDEYKIDLLRVFAHQLLIVNQVFNLTNITDPLEIAENMMLDSIVPGKFIPSGARVLDLGTGAGFPGIPLKIVFPNLSLTLIDSKRKKINFLKFVIRQLKLEGIEALQIRGEDLVKKEERGFDVVISRAVSSLDQLIRLASPLLKKDGMLMAMKGKGYLSELEPGKLAGAVGADRIWVDIENYRLPTLMIDRTLIIVRLNG